VSASVRAALAAGLAALLVCAGQAAAQQGAAPKVSQVVIEGNVRVEDDAIRVHLQTEPGDALDPALVDEDIRSVYAMGFFDQVEVDVTPEGANAAIVTFHVKERPLVRKVTIEGTDEVKEEEVAGALRVRPHTILDPRKLREGIDAAKALYSKEGYLDADIEANVTPIGENEVDVEYRIQEHDPIRIADIEFEGNEAFSDRKLRGLMQTKESWILSTFTGAGNLNRDVLQTDVERLTAYYYDHGFVTVRIDEPQIARRDDELVVTIRIDEGKQFDVGTVEVEGPNLPENIDDRVGELAMRSGEVFGAGAMRDDVQKLTEWLSEDGYAFAAVEPATNINADEQTVDIVYQVERGSPVVVDRIDITGNSKTRDNVVRREMRLQEQELFSGAQLRKSREALQRLGFFQEVNISTRKTAAPDRMEVVVNVSEAQTGAFSAGAGFSSSDNLLFNVNIRENNLFGRGQRLVLNADVGSIRRNIILSFTEPYLRGTPLTAGFDLFSWRLEFIDFARAGTGGGVQFTYPLTALGWDSLWGFGLEEVRIGLDYRLENASIEDVSQFAVREIRVEEGSSIISSVTPRISRNTVNHAFDPTAGSINSASFEVAGLGGVQFLKTELLSRWYYTFWRSKLLGDFTYSLGGTLGWGIGERGLEGDQLPLFERYFPGGINSLRGFEARTLGPREVRKNPFGRVTGNTPIGGSSEVLLTNEIIFPILKDIGLKGVVFLDAGNAYREMSDIKIDTSRFSVGGGMRWLSPLGPLRVELAFPLNEKPFDDTELIQFSFGGPFQF
jgi:outer membrane protein insertion porin family